MGSFPKFTSSNLTTVAMYNLIACFNLNCDWFYQILLAMYRKLRIWAHWHQIKVLSNNNLYGAFSSISLVQYCYSEYEVDWKVKEEWISQQINPNKFWFASKYHDCNFNTVYLVISWQSPNKNPMMRHCRPKPQYHKWCRKITDPKHQSEWHFIHWHYVCQRNSKLKAGLTANL